MPEKNIAITLMHEDEDITSNITLSESGIDFLARMFAPLLTGSEEE